MSTTPHNFDLDPVNGNGTNGPRRQLHELLNAALTEELSTEQLAHACALHR